MVQGLNINRSMSAVKVDRVLMLVRAANPNYRSVNGRSQNEFTPRLEAVQAETLRACGWDREQVMQVTS